MFPRQLVYKTKRFFRILFRMEQDTKDPTSCGALSEAYCKFLDSVDKLKLCDEDRVMTPLCGRDRNYQSNDAFGCKKLCDFRYAHEFESKKKS